MKLSLSLRSGRKSTKLNPLAFMPSMSFMVQALGEPSVRKCAARRYSRNATAASIFVDRRADQ
jgi:hypothetical protein